MSETLKSKSWKWTEGAVLADARIVVHTLWLQGKDDYESNNE